MGRLDQKVALVTGGASGLGKAIARRYISEGAHVVITDIQRDLGTATASEHGFMFIEQNVCDESQWGEVIEEVERRFGRLNILVNNAGILGQMEFASPENTPFADWKKIMSINLDGVFLGCKAAIPAMRRSGDGSIINISSVAGLLSTPYATAYGCSKAAVRQLTKSVAQHCALEKLHIRCNSVHPGDVRTPLWDKKAEEDAVRKGIPFDEVVTGAATYTPMGSLIDPEDIAAACVFLASDDARYITGTKMIVDGGIINCDTFLMMRFGS